MTRDELRQRTELALARGEPLTIPADIVYRLLTERDDLLEEVKELHDDCKNLMKAINEDYHDKDDFWP